MSEDLTLWVRNSISGFLYVVSAFFLILTSWRIHDLSFLQDLSVTPYLPYISLGVFALSTIVGYSAQIILENIIWLICPRFKSNAHQRDNNDQELQRRLRTEYSILVLYRHLILGSILLWGSLLIWLAGHNSQDSAGKVSLLCSSLLVLSIITYMFQRRLPK